MEAALAPIGVEGLRIALIKYLEAQLTDENTALDLEIVTGQVQDHEGELETLGSRVTAVEETANIIAPWVGPEGQLRVRLERLEQAVFALISDPHNPASSAAQAQAILTAIPVPQG